MTKATKIKMLDQEMESIKEILSFLINDLKKNPSPDLFSKINRLEALAQCNLNRRMEVLRGK